MTKETKDWWEKASKQYQKESKIPIGIHYGPRAPFEDELHLLGNLKGKYVLEIGCGGAQCGIAMAKQGAHVTGIDISEEQLKLAKQLAQKNKANIKFYQGDIKKLPQIKSNSQDIVFSAFALLYVDDLTKCFKEVYRVLKPEGIFVFSLDHPMYRTIDSKTLHVKDTYFHTGKFFKPNGFVMYNHTVSELINPLITAGFTLQQMIEPDSRKKYKHDTWTGLWNYTPQLLAKFPPTIIFKAKK